MRKIILLCVIGFGLAAPAWAFLGAVVGAAESARNTVYQKFMMLKAAQQLKTLRDNYVASKRYYAMYKKWNEGRGIVANLAREMAGIGDDLIKDTQAEFEDDWIYDPGYNSDLDALVESANRYASTKIRYAAKVFEQAVLDREEAALMAINAESADAKSAQQGILKAMALRLQIAAQTNQNLAQMIDLNARIYRLQLEDKEEQARGWSVFSQSIEEMKEWSKQQSRR